MASWGLLYISILCLLILRAHGVSWARPYLRPELQHILNRQNNRNAAVPRQCYHKGDSDTATSHESGRCSILSQYRQSHSLLLAKRKDSSVQIEGFLLDQHTIPLTGEHWLPILSYLDKTTPFRPRPSKQNIKAIGNCIQKPHSQPSYPLSQIPRQSKLDLSGLPGLVREGHCH